MERTVPYAASEEVELYLRTYYSLLRSSSEVQIRTLEEVHSGTNSLLHPGARDNSPDMSAFIYSILRLPNCIHQVRTVILGQSNDDFSRSGIGDVENWITVEARARRRRCYFDGKKTLACIIASRSDIDDVVPLLTAYQVEWKKIHRNLGRGSDDLIFQSAEYGISDFAKLAEIIKISVDDLERLRSIWGEDFIPNLKLIASSNKRMQVRLLSGSLREYRRATNRWWTRIEKVCPDLCERPIYFISSNTHSLVNLISGFALQRREELLQYLAESNDSNLITEWQDIQTRQVPSSRENFFYYLLKKYLKTSAGQSLNEERALHEIKCGIQRVDSEHFFDVDAQVIDLSKLQSDLMDARILDFAPEELIQSDALILNIDYPLGLAAYNILSEISIHADNILGVYILGKAATLNGVIGDVMIPKVIYDEHSRNTFIVPNAFRAEDVAPYLVYGTVLDNQKAVTVRGTFLQNANYMEVFYREGYTDIEMEAGPYLSAVYEMFRPKRHPMDEIVYLDELPFDFGILHYASDTPLSKGKNLGSSSLSYFGMDPAYATSLAILRRILKLEQVRLLKE